MKADPFRQLRLLDLQAIDTRLDQISYAVKRLPQHAAVTALEGELTLLKGDLVRAQGAVTDIQREVAKAESDVQQVRDRAARDQARLDAGQGSAKDLQAITHELESLARRQVVLEDAELEVMERAEGLEAEAARLETQLREGLSRRRELIAERDAAAGELGKEADQLRPQRDERAGGVGEELLALYEKVRAASGGLGAAELRARRCGGCQLELNNVDMGRIRAAADDELLRCDECRRILVRTPESGL